MMSFKTNRCRCSPRRLGVGGLGAFLTVALVGPPVFAQAPPSGRLPFEIEERPLQKVPTTFKFQSRISQARLPVGDVQFSRIFVRVMHGDSSLCLEDLRNVRVRDSVLNIEIGRQMNCQLDEVIANNNDLNFQICIERSDNCLKPIALSTVPYAVKASFAAVAQTAHQSNEAVQAHYALRITADPSVFGRDPNNETLGRGYYDFHPPTAEVGLGQLKAGTTIEEPSPNDGFMQWAPTPEVGTGRLNICLGDESGEVNELSVMSVYATETLMSGKLEVAGATVLASGAEEGAIGLEVHRDTRLNGALAVAANAEVRGATVLAEGVAEDAVGLEVHRNTELRGALSVARGAQLKGPVVVAESASAGALGLEVFRETKLNGGLAVVASAQIEGDLSARGRATLSDGLNLTGDSSYSADSTFLFNGDVEFRGEVSMPESFRSVPGPDTVTSASIHDGEVKTADIDDGAVGRDKIAPNAIASAQIEDGSIQRADLAADAVQLQENSVHSGIIRNGSVARVDLAADALVPGNNTVESGHIVDNSIRLRDLHPEVRTLGDNSVNGRVIAPSSIAAVHLSADAVTAGKIDDDAVGSAQLQDGAVRAAHIGSGAVRSEHLGSGAISSSKIQTNAIGAQHIAAGSVDASHLSGGRQEVVQNREGQSTRTAGGLCFLTSIIADRAGANCVSTPAGGQSVLTAVHALCRWHCMDK